MILSLRSSVFKKTAFVACSVAVLLLIAWKVGSLDESAPANHVAFVETPASPPMVPKLPTPLVKNEPRPDAPKPIGLTSVSIPLKETNHPIDTPRKLPTPGKRHDIPEALLWQLMQRFHSDAHQHFIGQPGMGFNRIMPTLSVVKREWRMPEWTSEELAKDSPAIKGAMDLQSIHRLSLNNFAYSNIMTLEERWQGKHPPIPPPLKMQHLWEIKSLDLVGLVVNETPVVYMSEKIPQMKDLKDRPTRELDLFEAEGLEELFAGKDLYIRSKSETIRVLGSIKAGTACLKCHDDVKEGALLGAFSYTLRPGQYLINGVPLMGINGFPGQPPLLPNPAAK